MSQRWIIQVNDPYLDKAYMADESDPNSAIGVHIELAKSFRTRKAAVMEADRRGFTGIYPLWDPR